MQKHILIVDDERVISGLIQKALAMEGFRASTAGAADVALHIVESDPPDLIICDFQLEDTDGLSLVAEIRKTMPDVRVLLVTGLGFDPDVVKGLVAEKKVSSYLRKTASLDAICSEVKRLLAETGPAA